MTPTTRCMLHTKSRSVGKVRSDSRFAISPRQQHRVALTRQYGAEALQEGQRFGGRERRLILDGIGDPAQQIGVGHRSAQRQGQFRYRQRKGARDMRENLILIDFICADGIHADSISKTNKDSIMSAA